jgi:hypothetical protein
VIQLLEVSFINEMNIRQNLTVQKFGCCGAANLKLHGYRKRRLTLRHGCPIHHRNTAAPSPDSAKPRQNCQVFSRGISSPTQEKYEPDCPLPSGASHGSATLWLAFPTELLPIHA